MAHHGSTGPKAIRCAVYTRKSTEEGLEQSFNSLDAQREACEAYILSQRHEGWTLVKDSYDDGGFSGGNMERPGLVRLLADVKAGRVNVIVVYKVDRLTRSLADFAKIVEVLDDQQASFVSVTQAFNTTTSMGRLTLNVLLSFAQFEREVTGERIRDKIAASKAKGMWMGGCPPLGYDVEDRRLVVNNNEAEQVRHMMERYVALKTGHALLDELRETGYRTKKSETRGGIVFTRGPLFHILNNRIYLGEIVHRGVGYPGQHQAIVSQGLWDAVQRTMAEQRVQRRNPTNVREASLLAGIITDGEGRRMAPSHANKGGRRYRYYITPASELEEGAPPAWRVPAHDLEAAVIRRIQKFLTEPRDVLTLLGGEIVNAASVSSVLILAKRISAELELTEHKRDALQTIVRSIQLNEDHIALEMDQTGLRKRLDIPEDAYSDQSTLILKAPAARVRRGKDVKLVISDGQGFADDARDEVLLDLLAEAWDAYCLVQARPDRTVRELAAEEGKCRTRFARLLRIATLAPEIIQACAEGCQPVSLTAKMLLQNEIPIGWEEQRVAFGFSCT
ncbi:MAG: recombinase family protein [Rhizorhabdus sp.]|nr:recombinase family protein [Rhizorhabdus sp.]